MQRKSSISSFLRTSFETFLLIKLEIYEIIFSISVSVKEGGCYLSSEDLVRREIFHKGSADVQVFLEYFDATCEILFEN